jgi:hypothetical protein
MAAFEENITEIAHRVIKNTVYFLVSKIYKMNYLGGLFPRTNTGL